MIVFGRSDSYTKSSEKLYKTCSHNPLADTIDPISTLIEPSIRGVYWGARRQPPKIVDDGSVFTAPSVHHSMHAIVGMTGGKDSLAAALCLRDEGYTVTFLHIRGINPAYTAEAESSLEQAKIVSGRYVELKVKIPKKEYLENPARNHVILLLQASVAVTQHAGTVVQGLHTQRLAANQPFDTGWSDCKEMADFGKEMIEGLAPWLENRLHDLPESDTESIDCVVHRAPDLLPLVRSCMQPLRYLSSVRSANIKKAGYDLLPGRCGSCYKCCREWLVLREHGYYKESQTYRDHVERLLVDKHALFCYGPESAGWGRDRILKTFLSRPTGKW